MSTSHAQPARSRFVRMIRVLAVPIILVWLIVALGTTLFVTRTWRGSRQALGADDADDGAGVQGHDEHRP